MTIGACPLLEGGVIYEAPTYLPTYLPSKACSLVTQVAVQRKLESTAQLMRDNGILPVRGININIKKLSKKDEELGEQGRWP